MLNQLKTFALLALLNALFVSLGWLLGGQVGSVIALSLAMVMNFCTWFYSDRLVLANYQARPVAAADAPALYAMVQQLARRAELPMPAVYIVANAGANAFATGRDPEHAAVAVTEGLLRLLPNDELEGVIAHELSHIAHRDTLIGTVAASIAGAISWLTWLPSVWRGRGQGAQALVIAVSVVLAPLMACILQMGISRAREFEADAGAGRLTQNPLALARALQRLETHTSSRDVGRYSAYDALQICNPPKLGWLVQWLSTHPPTNKRVARLMALDTALKAGSE